MDFSDCAAFAFNGAAELPEARSMRVTGAVESVDDAELVRQVSAERAAFEVFSA